jgi:DNA-binding CsgD family transcriptional regulator
LVKAIDFSALKQPEEQPTDPEEEMGNGHGAKADDLGMSDAQRRVFELLFTENTENTIAILLGLSYHTVHNHVRSILRKFDVHSRTELLTAALLQARKDGIREQNRKKIGRK